MLTRLTSAAALPTADAAAAEAVSEPAPSACAAANLTAPATKSVAAEDTRLLPSVKSGLPASEDEENEEKSDRGDGSSREYEAGMNESEDDEATLEEEEVCPHPYSSSHALSHIPSHILNPQLDMCRRNQLPLSEACGKMLKSEPICMIKRKQRHIADL